MLFVISFTPLTHKLRTANLGYKFQTGEAINLLPFMDGLMLYSKSGGALDSLTLTVRVFNWYSICI